VDRERVPEVDHHGELGHGVAGRMGELARPSQGCNRLADAFCAEYVARLRVEQARLQRRIPGAIGRRSSFGEQRP
jgi:hypothetical protein